MCSSRPWTQSSCHHVDKRQPTRLPGILPIYIPEGPLCRFWTDIRASRQKQGYRKQAKKPPSELEHVLCHLCLKPWISQRIEKSLSSLLSDVTIPPSLATLILDTPVGEPWIDSIGDLEKRLETIKARSRVKAARDLGEVVEGLRIVVRLLLPSFGNPDSNSFNTGGNETQGILPRPLPAYPEQCYNEYAGHPDVCVIEIQPGVCISTTPGTERCA